MIETSRRVYRSAITVALFLGALNLLPWAVGQELSANQIDRIKRSIVSVKTETTRGTGIIFANNDQGTFVLTNANVVRRSYAAGSVKCTFLSGTPKSFSLDATVVGRDDYNDIAFLFIQSEDTRISRDRGPIVSLAPRDTQVRETQDVLVASFPAGLTDRNSNGYLLSFWKSSISSLRPSSLKLPAAIQIFQSQDARSTGGPIFHSSGQVIGFLSSRRSGRQPNIAAPCNTIRDAFAGTIASVHIKSVEKQEGVYDLDLEGTLIDPRDNIRAVTLRFIDKTSLPDLPPLASWPALNGFVSGSVTEIQSSVFSTRIRIPEAKYTDDMIVQFTCVRKAGESVHTPPIALPRSPTPEANRQSFSAIQAVVALDLGKPIRSPSSFQPKQRVSPTSLPSQTKSTLLQNASPVLSPPSFRTRAANQVLAKKTRGPAIPLASEALPSGDWAVRRILLPTRNLLPKISWSSKETLICLDRSGGLYEIDGEYKLRQKVDLGCQADDYLVCNTRLFVVDNETHELVIYSIDQYVTEAVLAAPRNAKLCAAPKSPYLIATSGLPPWTGAYLYDLESLSFSYALSFGEESGPANGLNAISFTSDGSILLGVDSQKLFAFPFADTGISETTSRDLEQVSNPASIATNAAGSIDLLMPASLKEPGNTKLARLNSLTDPTPEIFDLGVTSASIATYTNLRSFVALGNQCEVILGGHDAERIDLGGLPSAPLAISVSRDGQVAALCEDGLFVLSKQTGRQEDSQ